jgi:hypothetical protein
MDTGVFLILFVAGAAALAAWIHVRAPRWAPTDLRGAGIHMLASMAASQLLAPLALRVAAGAGAAARLAVLLAVVFPATVYTCLAVIWLLRVLQRLVGGSIR